MLARASLVICIVVFGLAAYLRDAAAIIPFALSLAIALPRARTILNAAALSSAALALFYLASATKKAIVGQPLMGFDTRFMGKTLLMLAANDWRVLLGICAAAILLAVAAFAYLRAPRRRMTAPRFMLLGAVVSAAGLSAMWVQARPPAVDEINYGSPTVEVLLRSAFIGAYTLTPAPVAGDPVELASSDGERPEIAPPDMPHIVFILQESTVSPMQIGVTAQHQQSHLFVNRAGSHSGPLRIATFGGGSWLNAFALIAQFRADQLGPNRDYVFFTLENKLKRSIFTLLSERGYQTTAIYPATADYLNAGAFYRSAGVDAFYDPVAAGIGDGWNWRLPDEEFLDFALGPLHRDTPQVVYLQTINQHGPHALEDPMADYLRRFADSDDAHGAFVRAAARASSRPVVIVTFGDHLPLFMDTLAAAEDRHTTSYQIECTRPHLCDFSRLPDRMDISLLASALFDVVGFERDALMRAQEALLHDCADDIGACPEATLARYNWYVAREALRP